MSVGRLKVSLKGRGRRDMLGTVTTKGQMEEQELFKGPDGWPGRWDTHRERVGERPQGECFEDRKRPDVAKR